MSLITNVGQRRNEAPGIERHAAWLSPSTRTTFHARSLTHLRATPVSARFRRRTTA
jgi:hypothetical protein